MYYNDYLTQVLLYLATVFLITNDFEFYLATEFLITNDFECTDYKMTIDNEASLFYVLMVT